jgi:hypothetical protein
MAGKVINSSLVLISKFGASRQYSASKTATSHIRKPFYCIQAATVFQVFFRPGTLWDVQPDGERAKNK